jgi:hypothetical protein
VKRANIEDVSREEELSRDKVQKIFNSIEGSKKKLGSIPRE